jgi:Glycosyltransferase Family 4
MHILFIPSWYPCTSADIVGSFFREQAIAIKKQGCKVGVIALQIRSLRSRKLLSIDNFRIRSTIDEGVNTYRKDCINWYPKITKGHKKLWQYYGLVLFKRYIDAHGKPDIIHVHSMLYAGVIAYEIFNQYQIPYVLTEHSTLFQRGMIRPSQLSLALSIASSAKRRFAVSASFATFLTSYFEHKSGVWEVIPT